MDLHKVINGDMITQCFCSCVIIVDVVQSGHAAVISLLHDLHDFGVFASCVTFFFPISGRHTI